MLYDEWRNLFRVMAGASETYVVLKHTTIPTMYWVILKLSAKLSVYSLKEILYEPLTRLPFYSACNFNVGLKMYFNVASRQRGFSQATYGGH